MKIKLTTLIFCILLAACKNDSAKTEQQSSPQELEVQTLAEKIAYAHGYENWSKVEQFEFTFGGNIKEPKSGRSWQWKPKTNDITMMTSSDTISYNRNSMDSLALKTDPAFINDKFWALIPFQLIWDEGLTISEPIKAEAPISKTELSKVVMTYSNEGGYTPGDAYDLYIDEDYMIREWSFRKGNTEEPSLSNTFENYSNYNGIKVAQDHKFGEGDRNLLIRNVKVVLEE